ncbi:universal stress protein [Chloroflexota bacterium]
MYERILVPLDGSKISESALPYVKDLFSKMSKEVIMEVTLLHVIPPSHLTFPLDEESYDIYFNKQDYKMIKEKFIKYLNATAEMLRSEGIIVNVRVEFGDISLLITNIAEEINASMIAMSTHGQTGIDRWTIGSFTYKLLQLAITIPIMLVRPPKDNLKQ